MSEPTRRPNSQETPTVTVPGWVATDWPAAAAIAVRALGVMAVVGLVALVAALLIVLIQFDTRALDLGNLISTPFALPLVYLGGFASTPILLTGLAVLAFSLRLAMRPLTIGLSATDRLRALALACKVAVVTVAVFLLVAIVIDVLNVAPTGRPGRGFFGTGTSSGVDYVRVVFLTGPVVATTAFLVLARRIGVPALALMGVPGRLPSVIATSWAGASRILRVALPGLLILYAVGSLLELLGQDFGAFSGMIAGMLSLLVFGVVLTAVDVATLFFISAMSFLQFESLGQASPWEWVGVVLVAVAFFLGGRAAAEKARAPTAVAALTAASMVGLFLAGLGVLVAIDYGGIGGLEGVAAPAILLPLLWTLPALGGAWFYAVEHNLPSGVAVATSASTDTHSGPPEASGPATSDPTSPPSVSGRDHSTSGAQATPPEPSPPPPPPQSYEEDMPPPRGPRRDW